MKLSRNRLIAVTLGTAALAATVISPALGGPSLRKLVKKEVAKQIGKASGPPGVNGTNGTNGADGTARAYARVSSSCAGVPPEVCTFDRAKGVTAVTRPLTGFYCVTVPGISTASVPAEVTVETSSTTAPFGNGIAMVYAPAADCTGGQFEVLTQRRTGATTTAAADDVGFTIVIP